MNNRSKVLLRELVELHIEMGQPISSQTLSRRCSLALSPATIRHMMVDLESEGFVSSLHSSSGRIPTYQGYRFFIDKLLFFLPSCRRYSFADEISSYFNCNSIEQLMQSVARFLSASSFFVGIVQVPQKKKNQIVHFELLKLSSHRLLFIVVGEDGSVSNQIVNVDCDYSSEQLLALKEAMQKHCFERSSSEIAHDLCIRSDIHHLFIQMTEISDSFIQKNNKRYCIEGKNNLFSISDFSKNIDRLRGLFDIFEKHSLLFDLLDRSITEQGVRVFIGDELNVPPLFGCSLVLAPYMHHDRMAGALGVVGPLRMNYDRMISLVSCTAHFLSQILSKDVLSPL